MAQTPSPGHPMFQEAQSLTLLELGAPFPSEGLLAREEPLNLDLARFLRLDKEAGL